MTFVAEATRDGGLCMRKGECKIYAGGFVRLVPAPGRVVRPYPDCDENMSVPAMSRPELELRLAAMGLRLRRFPCCCYRGSWRMFGTEAV